MVIKNDFMEEYFVFLHSNRTSGLCWNFITRSTVLRLLYVTRSRCELDSGKIPVITDATSKHIFKAKVAQLVEALCYKPEGRRFDSWWCHWKSFWPHYGGCAV
jgi:hypothetical protein